MLDRLAETVVAVSSAPGHGAVGIVRLSGPDALAVADRMVVIRDGVALGRRRAPSRVWADIPVGEGLLPADIYLFRAPKSYTRQHLVEIHTVGSPAAVEAVRKLAVSLGARPAEAGEFTARAFLNGAMDLTAAEAVARVVSAQSDAQLRAARRMMDGLLAGRIGEFRDALAELLALLEADIDFAEEAIEFITPQALRSRLEAIAGGLSTLVAGAKAVEEFNVLPQILLFGPPNTGKSSLMNRLSGTSRAICAAVAGTTRDVLSAPITLGRGEAILLDAAGVDESPGEIIAQAREMVLSTAGRVDLLCVVLDASKIPPESGTPDFDPASFPAVVRSLNAPRMVVAANKCDLLSEAQRSEAGRQAAFWGFGSIHFVSALHGEGVDGLRAAFSDALGVAEVTVGGEAIMLSERQRAAIGDAIAPLERAAELSKSAVETVDCADLLAFELREALDSLGVVTGAVTTEDLLSAVFANFCIGK